MFNNLRFNRAASTFGQMLLAASAKRRGDRRRLTESAYTGSVAQNFELRPAAFTLIELLAALAVMSMLVVLLFKAFSSTSGIVISGSNEMEKNQVVRAVLQQVARDIERTY